MIFTYDYWESFCKQLHTAGVHSIPACDLMQHQPSTPWLVLKHDVETNVSRALCIAEIEQKYGHKGSWYVQAYLLKSPANIDMLKRMQAMGHEISYHHDVMDSNGGDLTKALAEFEQNCALFEENGFTPVTLCQHGNPVVERKGYTSNRDFFRSAQVQQRFPHLTDIMVDFKQKASGTTDYLYFSDAGRQFKHIYDPINNDLIPSGDKDIPFDELSALLAYIREAGGNCIISMHPHRWVASASAYIIKTTTFKIIRATAKMLMRVPFCKKLMSRYFYLAKKI